MILYCVKTNVARENKKAKHASFSVICFGKLITLPMIHDKLKQLFHSIAFYFNLWANYSSRVTHWL